MALGFWSPAAWQAIGTGITAFVAAVAAGFAWRQVGEARKAREQQIRPFVVVDFE